MTDVWLPVAVSCMGRETAVSVSFPRSSEMAFMSGSPVLTDERFNQQGDARGGGFGGQGRGNYDDPAGAPTNYSTMTVGGSITATAVLLVLLVGAAIFGWLQVDQPPRAFNEL